MYIYWRQLAESIREGVVVCLPDVGWWVHNGVVGSWMQALVASVAVLDVEQKSPGEITQLIGRTRFIHMRGTKSEGKGGTI